MKMNKISLGIITIIYGIIIIMSFKVRDWTEGIAWITAYYFLLKNNSLKE